MIGYYKDKETRIPRRIPVWIKLAVLWFCLVAFAYSVYFSIRTNKLSSDLTAVHHNTMMSIKNEQQQYQLRRNNPKLSSSDPSVKIGIQTNNSTLLQAFVEEEMAEEEEERDEETNNEIIDSSLHEQSDLFEGEEAELQS